VKHFLFIGWAEGHGAVQLTTFRLNPPSDSENFVDASVEKEDVSQDTNEKLDINEENIIAKSVSNEIQLKRGTIANPEENYQVYGSPRNRTLKSHRKDSKNKLKKKDKRLSDNKTKRKERIFGRKASK
jgi:hypothetical protein